MKRMTRQIRLYEAIAKGKTREVEQLIAHGVHLNARDAEEWSPLIAAISKDSLSIAKILLANGAKPNLNVGDGFTPLHLAAGLGRKSMAKLLIRSGARVNAKTVFFRWAPLHIATFLQERDMIHFLLNNGADINARLASGDTTLRLAVITEPPDVELVRFLLAKGADVNALDELPAESFRKSSGYKRVLRLVERHRARINLFPTTKARSKATRKTRGEREICLVDTSMCGRPK